MSIDKQKLQKLLWAEAASFRADCADWKRNTEALQDFLGEKTVEEVALELLAENEALRKGADRYRWLQQWYIEGRPRSEIHADGHICFTTPVIMDLSIDVAIGKGEQS